VLTWVCSRVIIYNPKLNKDGATRISKVKNKIDGMLFEVCTDIRMPSSLKQINLHKDGMRWEDRLVPINPFYAYGPDMDVLCFVLADSSRWEVFRGRSGELRRKVRGFHEVDGRMSPCVGYVWACG
jgi:hypothetical protein